MTGNGDRLTADGGIIPPGVADAFPSFNFTFNESEMKALDVLNAAYLSRQELLRRTLDPRRSINDECGFPDAITIEHYRMMWEREAVADRVNSCYCRESWQVQPGVYEDEDPEKVTEFEEAWDKLGKYLQGDGEKSWYKDEKGSPIWSLLLRGDELSGIGQFGCILLGFDDGEQDLTQPVKPKKGMKLLYASVFDESLAKVAQLDNRRRPKMYNLQVSDLDEASQFGAATGIQVSNLTVHHSRVLHLADIHHTASASEIFAVPRMRSVFNNLLGLRKLYGGSPEMYWKGAFPGYSWESHPSLGSDVKINRTKFRDQMEQFMNGLQRYTANIGGSLKALSPQVSDPTAQVKVQIEAICIKLGIPMRIFMGSERGELASGQDDSTWNDRLRDRQWNYITPRIIVPFVNRLIWAGVLPEPESFHVEWPDLDSPKAQTRAQVALTFTQALTAYLSGGGENGMTLLDWYTRIAGMDDEIAQSIVDNVQKQMETLNPDTDEELIPGHTPSPPEGDEFGDFEETGEDGTDEEAGFGGEVENVLTDNVFCKTGQGGGVDPTCKAHAKQFKNFAKSDALYMEEGKLHMEKKSGEKFIHVYQQKPKDAEGLKAENRVWLTSDGKKAPKFVHEAGLTPQWMREVKKDKKGEPVKDKEGKTVYTGRIVENPFARKNIMVNIDQKNPSVLHISEDAKGKVQVKMSDNKASKNAAADHGRIDELKKKEGQIVGEMRKDAKNPLHKEEAELQILVHQTGIRSGGNQTDADYKSYGAVTLEGRHVVIKNGKTYLKFVPGKSKGQEKTYEITDPETAKMLQQRAKAAGPKGTLFNTTAKAARDYLKSKDGGGFKTKDLRKLRSTDLAVIKINEYIKEHGKPKTAKEYLKAVRDIADEVAENIGNTRNMQLNTYTNPTAWHALRPANVNIEFGYLAKK